MVSKFKKIALYFNLVFNHGISITTILNSKHSCVDKL